MRLICLTVAVVALLAFSAAASTGSEPLKLLLISDLHYDKFYGTAQAEWSSCRNASAPPFGLRGCDSPLTLMQAMVKDIQQEYGDVLNFTVFTGDWLRHKMYKVDFAAAETASAVGEELAALPGQILASPHIPPLAAALGNNDFVPDYEFQYQATANDTLLAHFTDIMTKHNFLKDSNESTVFRRCGFYRRRNVVPNLDIIVLNSLIWCDALRPTTALENHDEDPCSQLVFLQEALAEAEAAGNKAYIMSHIPPLVNLWDILEGGNETTSHGHFWNEFFVEKYKAIVKNYTSTVAFQFYGHTHKFAFVGDDSFGPPLMILPALSPVFGNTPSYLVATVDSTTFGLLDIHQRSINMDTGNWSTGDSFRSLLFPGSSAITSETLANAACRLIQSDEYWNTYAKIYGGGGVYVNQFSGLPAGDCDTTCRSRTSCTYRNYGYGKSWLGCLDDQDNQCYAPPDHSVSGSASSSSGSAKSNIGPAKGTAEIVSVSVVFGCLLLLGVGSVLFFIRRKRLQHKDKEAANLTAGPQDIVTASDV